MKSNRFIKSVLSLMLALFLVCGVSCSNTNILDAGTVDVSSETLSDKSDVTITFQESRGWVVSMYEVTATNDDTGVSETAKGSSSSVKIKLSAGEWTFVAKGYDANNTLIYKGKFVTEISSTTESISIIMVKKSGSMTYNIAKLGENVGTYQSIKIIASKDTFDSVTAVVSSFSEKAIFTGLAAGEWIFKTYLVNGSTETLLATESYDIIADAIVNKVSEGNPIVVTAAPVIKPAGGVYTTSQNVTITCSEPATIYYTTDGSKPTASSLRYNGAIQILSTTTIKAMAIADGKTASNVSSATITITPVVTTTTIEPDPITDKIILHAYGYTHLWAWNENNANENYTGGKWPGATMTQENDKWYTYTLNVTSSMVIFSNNGGGQTGDLKVAEAGEYWYKNNQWHTTNPDDSDAPVLVLFDADKETNASGNVTLSISATDNAALKNAKFTIDGKELGSVNLSGTTANCTYTFDTTKIPNGTHTLSCIVYDEAGNQSEAKTKSISTNNANLPPIAKITGTIAGVVGKTIPYSAANSYDQNGGTITAYRWTVTGATSDSTTAQKINVTMPSTEGATVKISLVVTDNDGASSEAVSITIKTVNIDENWDFRDETIYFLMTTRFYDGDKNNNAYCWDDEECFKSITLGDPGWRGDFKGLTEKLDYIKALGFSAIWITPVVENSSGLDYHGYHASDFSKVDPRYAGLNEDPMDAYQNLIDACHEKGIKVIQDIVLNHTSNFGENGFFRLFDTADKSLDSKGVTKAITSFASDESAGALSSGLYGLHCLQNALNGADYWNLPGGSQYGMRINAMKEDSIDIERAYHHEKSIQWEGYTVQTGQMAGDCVDINTENHKVSEYIRNAYIQYINMGVDAFRIDTVKHISRLTFNKEFLPYFKAAGEANGKDFFMFGEGCVLRNEVWNDNKPPISVPFYTWKGNDDTYSWSETDPAANEATVLQHYTDNLDVASQPRSTNAFLNGNEYHEPDRSQSSGLDMIDFYMHHCFGSAGSAFGVAKQEDAYFNDATYNVMYVDSHDYGPNEGGYLYMRYSGGTAAWANNFSFMFTFRGIPCVYYGSEIEFQKNMQIEPYTNGNKVPYARSGRAYFGDHIEGSVNVSDYGMYSDATGAMATTLSKPLAQHVRRLNLIRRAIPALRKGQYSTDGCSGSVSYKRAYKKNGIDSYVLVTVGGGSTFTGVRSGTYVEVVTGKTVSCSGTLTSDAIGEGNMRVYVLQTGDGVEPTGKIGVDGAYLK